MPRSVDPLPLEVHGPAVADAHTGDLPSIERLDGDSGLGGVRVISPNGAWRLRFTYRVENGTEHELGTSPLHAGTYFVVPSLTGSLDMPSRARLMVMLQRYGNGIGSRMYDLPSFVGGNDRPGGTLVIDLARAE